MKSITKSGFGIGILVFAAAVIIALPLRTLQYFTVLESETGFFIKNDWSVYLLGIVLFAAVIFSVAFGFIKRKALDYSLETIKRPGQGILSLTACAGILMSTASVAAELINATASFSREETTNNTILIIQSVFGVLSAIYFLAIGLSFLGTKSNGSEYRLISLAPVIWSIFRLVLRFTRTISYIRVSDLMLEMLMLVFFIMFFMAFAQVSSRVDGEKKEWKIAAYGLPAALLALVCFVPRFIVMISGNADLLNEQSPADYCDFGVALFIISTVVTRVTTKIPNAVSETAITEE